MNGAMPTMGASVQMATCGVRNFEWVLPKLDGRMP